MKSFIQISALVLLGTVTSLAQNSPHNYKRPVNQQNTSEIAGVKIEQTTSEKYKVQPLNASVHNYKRQGSVDMSTEAKFAFAAPKIQPPVLNPLSSPNHYKLHFQPTSSNNKVAVKNTKKPNTSSAK
jgi:hypothetical protein